MDLLSLGIGVICLASGIRMISRPARWRGIADARWRKRLAELDGGAPDIYFEERRSLIAYPPHRTDRRVHVAGIIRTLCGLASIVLSFRH